MRCFLITALIAVFLLAFFCHSGSGLKCYTCPISSCKTNTTCPPEKDACIVAYLGSRNVSDCWTYSQCNLDYVGNYFKAQSFRFVCCQKDLCNGSSIPMTSKIVFAIASLLTVINIVSF
ncbi:hypothetical protein JD844_021583 [Phrynosoma platyrhinos]|uniref:MAC-inhibitory protein n=1 Tax=Phrynosoma platyrhinos TaxID=52577 RepID=A0ABQ7STQ7_PHRPL|nr:hypothetical protein JD844_021583 [Phrynosoma platyrhinos]